MHRRWKAGEIKPVREAADTSSPAAAVLVYTPETLTEIALLSPPLAGRHTRPPRLREADSEELRPHFETS